MDSDFEVMVGSDPAIRFFTVGEDDGLIQHMLREVTIAQMLGVRGIRASRWTRVDSIKNRDDSCRSGF